MLTPHELDRLPFEIYLLVRARFTSGRLFVSVGDGPGTQLAVEFLWGRYRAFCVYEPQLVGSRDSSWVTAFIRFEALAVINRLREQASAGPLTEL